MPTEVLRNVRNEWKRKADRAYKEARERLEDEIGGKFVRLRYPKKRDETARVQKVTGQVSSVSVGRIPEEGVEFSVWVEFEGGEEFMDPEAITVVEGGGEPDRGWRDAEKEVPPRMKGDAEVSERVEVYIEDGTAPGGGRRAIDYYLFTDGRWDTEIGSSRRVTYWKPLEPGPTSE